MDAKVVALLGRSITVSLDAAERSVLAQMSMDDGRYPKQQITWLIHQEAQRRGLLPAANDKHAEDISALERIAAALELLSKRP